MTTTPNDSAFIGDPDGGDGLPRSNGLHAATLGEPCSSCAQPLVWDRYERMVYCPNDWYHG